MAVRPQTETERRLTDVIEKELNATAVNDRYPDTKTKLRITMKSVEIRCLAIMIAEAVIRGDKHIKLTCKRRKPKVVKNAPRGVRTFRSEDDEL